MFLLLLRSCSPAAGTAPPPQVVMHDYPVSAAIIAERGAERARSLQVRVFVGVCVRVCACV